ncbi:MAG: SUMF1/EgtB/PvdO family nonheme iron enzyme [Nannocystaceae bacterium]
MRRAAALLLLTGCSREAAAPPPTLAAAPVETAAAPATATPAAAPVTATSTPPPQNTAPASVTITPRAVEMVSIAAAEHHRSSVAADQSAPVVALPGFALDREAVTRADYAACVAAGACPELARATDCAGAPDDPLACVDLYEASSYCAWAGKRLPREDEWEAARSQLARDPSDHHVWLLATHCGPHERTCLPLAPWSVDGWREAELTAVPRGESSMPHPQPHQASPQLGLRCARDLEPPRTPVYGEPCWVSCDGCDDVRDGVVDRRVVGKLRGGRLRGFVELDARGALVRKSKPQPPGAMIARAIQSSIVLDPARRTIAFARNDASGTLLHESLVRDAAGNVTMRVTTGPGIRQHWRYHYGCYRDDAAELRAEANRCPREQPPRIEPQTDFGRCVPGSHGRWELVFDDLVLDCARDEGPGSACNYGTAQGRWSLRYVADTGVTATTTPEAFSLLDAEVLERRTLTAFDYDGDGHDELALRRVEGHVEDAGVEVELWRFDGAAIVRYEPATRQPGIEDVVDVDRDGRPDLLRAGGLEIPSSGEMGETCFGGVRSVARSLPSGDFALDVRETRDDLKRQCPAAPRGPLFVDGDTGPDAVHRIACAWVWGEDRAALRSRIDSEWKALACEGSDNGCACDRATIDTFVRELPTLAAPLGAP